MDPTDGVVEELTGDASPQKGASPEAGQGEAGPTSVPPPAAPAPAPVSVRVGAAPTPEKQGGKRQAASPQSSPHLSPPASPQSPSSPAARAQNVASILWEYVGSDGNVYGPFNQGQMLKWYTAGKFPADLPIRLAGIETRFVPLFEKWAAQLQRNQVPFSMVLAPGK